MWVKHSKTSRFIWPMSSTQERYIHIESDTHAILALSNILLVKNSQSSEIFVHYFPDSMLCAITEKVQEEKFGVVSFNSDTKKKKKEYHLL